jgi:hypothetical protein
MSSWVAIESQDTRDITATSRVEIADDPDAGLPHFFVTGQPWRGCPSC